MRRTFREGVGGGILGCFIGAPGLGLALGVAHANKDLAGKANKESKKFDRGYK